MRRSASFGNAEPRPNRIFRMNLLFDFGGVIVDLDKQRCIKAFEDLGFDIRPYLGAYRQAGIFSLLEQGRITVQEFCVGIRELSACDEISDEAIIQAWEKYLLGIPAERLELLLKIKQNYPVSVLSNTNIIHWEQSCEDFFSYKGLGVNDFFDKLFLSYELGVEKPAPELYHKVIEGLGVPAEDILFFDDSEVNCEAARQCGMQALLAPAGSEWFKYFDENGKLQLS